MNLLLLTHASTAILLITMAALQLNDPDPVLWVVVYLSVAVMPIAKIFQHRLPTVYRVAVGLTLACLLMSGSGFIDYLGSGDYASLGDKMMAEKPYIESAREFLGTAIAVFVLFCYRRWHGVSLAA